MATIDELVIELTAETKGLQTELKSAVNAMKGATDQMAKSVEGFAKDGSASTSTFQTALGTMAGFIGGQVVIGAFMAVKDAVLGLASSMISDGVAGASEQQDAMQALSQVLARTGRLTGNTAKEFEAFAGQLQTTSKFTDDQAISAGKLLANLTNLNGEGLQKATQASADLAAAMGIDLETAARLVGKSINGQTDSLKKYGIEVKAGSNDAENFANVLKVVNERFGGSAASQTLTYSGAVDQVKKQWGEATEVIGNAIVSNKVVINVLNSLGKVLGELQGFMAANSEEIKTFVAEGVLKAIDALAFMGSIINETIKVFQFLGQVIAAPFQALAVGLEAANAAANGDFAKAKDIIVSGTQDIGNEFSKTFEDSKAFTVFSDKLAEVRGSAQGAFDAMKTGAEGVVEPINNAAAALNQMTAEQKAALDAATEFSINLAGQADTQAEIYALELQALEDQHANKLLSDQEYFAAKEAMVNQNILNEQAALDAAIAAGTISKTQAGSAQLALTMKSNADQMKLISDRTKFEMDQNKLRQENFGSTLSTIASLASSNNKTLAAIGKAAAITQATIDGYAAVQKALASAPPPFNFALAAAVGLATAANVSKIAGTPLATGIDSVPGIGGADNFPAVLAPGERVVPASTNEDLKAFLSEQNAGPRNQINVNVTMNDVFTSEPREMGLKIVEMINEVAQANGIRVLGSTIG
jgi:hypothetical protein